VEQLSPAEARRIPSRGFSTERPKKGHGRATAKTFDWLSLHQIGSVNILIRAHYLPVFSRLGPMTGL
jgi:uncharacterized protein YcaQ